jgi:hypothetical protein
MAKISWACPECDVETHFKGLCRNCTEYDEAGQPIKPIHRVRKNYAPTNYQPHIPSKNDFLNSRRRKPTNKQIVAIQEHFNAQSHECGDDCEHDEEFTEVGESIGSEEE